MPPPYSLCISTVCATTTATQIKDAFHSLGVAHVSHVDLIPNYTHAASSPAAMGTNRAFIYITKWETTPNAQIALQHLLSNESNFKLMHQFPHFWRVVVKKTKPATKPMASRSYLRTKCAPDVAEWPRSPLVR